MLQCKGMVFDRPGCDGDPNNREACNGSGKTNDWCLLDSSAWHFSLLL
jgi:hypothetical protein